MDKHLQTIKEQILQAEAHLADIRQAMKVLERAGTYPAVPLREAFELRDNGNEYMYHYFGMNNRGDYEGPGGKRKVYVGIDPARIAEARVLASNREEWEALQRVANGLEMWLKTKHRDLAQLTGDAKHWPRADLDTLGLPAAAGEAANSPNET